MLERSLVRLRVVESVDFAGMLGGSSAMTVQIEMPELSTEAEGATLATWLVSVGDSVEKGDVIAELETDKSTVELESPATGTLKEFRVEEGTEGIAAGVILALIEGEGEGGVDVGVDADLDVPAAAEKAAAAPPASSPQQAASTSEGLESTQASSDEAISNSAQPTTVPEAGHLRGSTPLARRAAADHDVDLGDLVGSGAGGRVLEADVIQSADATAPQGTGASIPEVEISGAVRTERLSAMRKTIARRMTEAKQQVPHFYLRSRCPMDAVMEVRAKLNQDLSAEGRELKISVNDFILRAAALALRDVPEANVRFAGHEMHFYQEVDVCVAVATDGGLVTPVVRNADRKGLAILAAEVKELAGLARSGKLRPDQYQGGNFTISNLGMYGIETVYPILNPPQACILGVGAADEVPVVRDGLVGVGRVASLALAADHRAVDGAVAAQFLAALRARLEDPLSMML